MKMRIFTRVTNQKSLIPLEINSNDTVLSLKEKIKSATKNTITSPSLLKVTFGGTVLEDQHSISYYKIQRDSLIQVQVHVKREIQSPEENPTFNLFVNPPSGNSIMLHVKNTDSVGVLKKQISEASKIPDTSFDLCQTPLENSSTLCDHPSIHDGSILYMTLKLRDPEALQLFVVMSNKCFTLDVHSNDTVQYMKALIQEREGVEVDKQTLLYEGKALVNSLTLSHYNIPNNSSLDLHCD